MSNSLVPDEISENIENTDNVDDIGFDLDKENQETGVVVEKRRKDT